MKSHNIEAKDNIELEVNAPCPKCNNGHLLPFVRARYKNEGSYGEEKDFDHYEIFYRCSKCNHSVESDSFF